MTSNMPKKYEFGQKRYVIVKKEAGKTIVKSFDVLISYLLVHGECRLRGSITINDTSHTLIHYLCFQFIIAHARTQPIECSNEFLLLFLSLALSFCSLFSCSLFLSNTMQTRLYIWSYNVCDWTLWIANSVAATACRRLFYRLAPGWLDS